MDFKINVYHVRGKVQSSRATLSCDCSYSFFLLEQLYKLFKSVMLERCCYDSLIGAKKSDFRHENNFYFYRTIVTVFQILIAYRINTKYHDHHIYKK